MEKRINKFIYWTPRILSIMFLCFLAVFSLDVISPGLSFWQIAAGLFIHNIPVFILLIVLLISWKYEIIGGIIFIIAGSFFTVRMLWFGLSQSIIAAPALLIGILFIVNWFKKNNRI